MRKGKLSRKVFALLLSLAMVVTMMPTMALTAFANENDVAQIGSGEAAKTYTSLTKAFQEANDGDIVKILKNFTATNSAVVEHNITLDLNGYTITVAEEDQWEGVSPTGQAVIYVKSGGKLTVTDSSTDEPLQYGAISAIDNENVYAAILMTISNDNDENKTAELVVDKGFISGYYYGVATNGNRHNTKITVNNGTIMGSANNQESTAIYHPNKGTLLINGGNFTGNDGILIKGGSPVSITGGTFIGYGAEKEPEEPRSSGCNNVGSALYVEGNYGYGACVNISGGNFYTMKGAPAVQSLFNEEKNPTIIISGGYFSNEPDNALIKENFECVTNTEDETKDTYGYKVQAIEVAQIGEDIYPTLEEAIAKVEDGGTIKLLKDSNVVTNYDKVYGEDGYSEAANANRLIIGRDGAKNFTLDLNDKILTGRINFLHGNLTVTNGKIVSSSQAINIYGSKDYNDKNTNYTVVTVEEDVEITAGTYGVCVFGGNPDNIYWPLGFGEVVNFYGKVTAPVGIGNSGNIGMDTYKDNLGTVEEIENLVSGSDCSSCSELMTKYGPVLNFYNDAVIEASEQAVYWPGLGKINVKGGSITGTEAIGIKGGIVNVSGGTLTATGPKCDPVAAVNSGEESSGATISISTYYNENYPIDVNISGGTLKSTNNVALLVAHSVKGGIATPVKKGINLTVSGGKFSGASELGGIYVEAALDEEVDNYPTKFITGGLFDKDVTAHVADGYVCVALATTDHAYADGYRYIVKPVEVIVEPAVVGDDNNITVGGKKITVEGAGEEQGQPTAQEAANAINETLNNHEVTGFSDTKIEEATPATVKVEGKVDGFDLSMVLNAVKEAAAKKFTGGTATATQNDEITVKTTSDGDGEKFGDTDVTKQITVDLTAAAVTQTKAETTTTTVTSMTFEVKPVANITVTNGEGKADTVTAIIPNNAITAPITFRLPVDSSVSETWAAVYHEGVFMGNYEIKTGTGGKYIEVSSMEFSKFSYVLVNSESAGAKIGEVPYQTLVEAIASVENGKTIILQKDASGDATVKREVSFSINNNGHANNAKIVAGDGYKLYESGNNYTIKKTYNVAAQDDGNGTATVQIASADASADAGVAAAGDTVTFVAIPKTGYVFDRWKVVSGDANLLKDIDTKESIDITMIPSELVLKACFENNTAPVKPEKPSINPILPFIAGVGTALVAIPVIGSIIHFFTGEQTFTVAYDMQGHGDAIADVTVKENGVLVEPTTPVAEGWTFGGWFKDVECQYAWNFAEDQVTKNMTLYAKWTEVKKPEPVEPETPVFEKKSVLMLQAKTDGEEAIKLTWNGISGATKYEVYGNSCGKDYIKLKTTTNKSYTVKKINGKKLKAHSTYKFYVVAYTSDGKVKSKAIHFITANTKDKMANVKSIKAKKSSIELKVGETGKVGATYKMYSDKKHVDSSHGKALRYISDCPQVVSVNASGELMAKNAGTATIYIQDIGGKYCKTVVTVK